jgi:hypothetical protein
MLRARIVGSESVKSEMLISDMVSTTTRKWRPMVQRRDEPLFDRANIKWTTYQQGARSHHTTALAAAWSTARPDRLYRNGELVA